MGFAELSSQTIPVVFTHNYIICGIIPLHIFYDRKTSTKQLVENPVFRMTDWGIY